jgi:glycosyltransferase involved in cell wall biosynthesis
MRAFFLYRDSALRREALLSPPGSGSRYSLFGLDEAAGAGLEVVHNLEPGREASAATRAAAATLDRGVRVAGGYSGNFAAVLACRRALNGSDVVFSTVDTVGIPLALLARAGVVRTPIVYAAIGLPERIVQLGARAGRFYRDAYRRLHTIVAYGSGEVDALRDWLGADGPSVVFVPFGADPAVFRPRPEIALEADVVSVGADPRRDYELLLALARKRREWSFRIVATRDRARALAAAPPNVVVETDLAFDLVQERLAAGKVVVLPVRENTYSGATTVLLQAMASGKAVAVTRTAAIARGYHLEDGANCSFVPPGDLEALERAVSTLLADAEQARAMGSSARETIERYLTWERYTARMRELLLAAATSTVPA